MASINKERIRKSNTIKLIEIKFGIRIEELLRQDYMEKRMTILDMAEKYEISPCTVHNWLVKYDIPRRKLTFL